MNIGWSETETVTKTCKHREHSQHGSEEGNEGVT